MNSNFERVKLACCNAVNKMNLLGEINPERVDAWRGFLDVKHLGKFRAYLKQEFNELVFENYCHDFVEVLTKRGTNRPHIKNDQFSIIDVAAYMNNRHYFSAEKARQRLSDFGRQVDNSPKRLNLKGQAVWVGNQHVNQITNWFVSTINANRRLFLTLAARLCKGDNRFMKFKANQVDITKCITARAVDHQTFEIEMQYGDDVTAQQVFEALCAISPDMDASDAIFPRILRTTEKTFRVRVKDLPKTDEKELNTVSGTFDYDGNTFTYDSSMTYPAVIKKPDPVLVETHYANMIEASINELSQLIDTHEAEVFRLSSMCAKMKAQRFKLTKAIEALNA